MDVGWLVADTNQLTQERQCGRAYDEGDTPCEEEV